MYYSVTTHDRHLTSIQYMLLAKVLALRGTSPDGNLSLTSCIWVAASADTTAQLWKVPAQQSGAEATFSESTPVQTFQVEP